MDLEKFRNEIDTCDREIVSLLNRRAKAAIEIGKEKRKAGKNIFAPEREKAVYDKIAGLNEGPLCQRNLHAIYREIMSGCIALEAPTRISYLGPPGTFTHQAAMEKFGNSMEYLPAPEIRDVFLAVSRDHADYGVVPIENSTEGAVTATADMLMQTELKICSEIFLGVHQVLVSNSPLDEIELVLSHPNALAQCRNWLGANLSGVSSHAVPSTALAADRASKEKGVAAVCSEAVLSLYDFSNVERCIEDNPNNTTRFIVLSHDFAGTSGDDRTSVVFSCSHKSGSLYHALEPFNKKSISLTRIESRPAKKKNWEYSFFVDIEGHADDPVVKETLDEVAKITDDFRLLGSYPRGAHLVRSPSPIA